MSATDPAWHRGTCPRCESPEVLLHVIGLPLAGVMESSPHWVRWDGCLGLGPDRECTSCGWTWWEHDHGHAEQEEFDPDDAEEEPAAPLRVVGAVLVDAQDRVLAARRRAGLREAGRWEFPGGKIEPGESPQEALRRELREELGVETRVGWLIGRGTTGAGGRELHLDCYWARVLGARPASSTDHDELAWLDRDALAERDWPEADQPIVDLLVEGALPRF